MCLCRRARRRGRKQRNLRRTRHPFDPDNLLHACELRDGNLLLYLARLLLEDLELVLAEIAQLTPEAPAGDRELIREGIERGGVLSRLRTVVPAGTTPTRGDL